MLDVNEIYNMNCLDGLKLIDDNSIDCCITSPPYWGLRDYGVSGQIGLEETPEKYINKMVEVFQEVKRILKPEGTLWLNLGDSYAGSGKGAAHYPECTKGHKQATNKGTVNQKNIPGAYIGNGLKPKDLIGIPWMVAFALRADGWYLRSDIIWHKPNPMPESVTDRPTKSHEYIFLMSKSGHYYYNQEAIREPAVYPESNTPEEIMRVNLRKRRTDPKENGKAIETSNYATPTGWDIEKGNHGNFHKDGRRSGNIKRKYGEERDRPNSHIGASIPWEGTTKNKRDVWTIASQPCKAAHFATFPPKLIEPCVLAGCPADGIVLDPFMGSGTTAKVALENQRNFIGFELNPEYIKIAKEIRLNEVQIKMA